MRLLTEIEQFDGAVLPPVCLPRSVCTVSVNLPVILTEVFYGFPQAA
jgi:hypothetical protein